ncbi:MAG: C39 family peptidase [Acidobacteriota bacterium]
MGRAVATLATSLALLSLTAPAAAPRRGGNASVVPFIDVPYVSQGELLCGGAAAAMLMRAAGARQVYAEDFESLVDVAAGGIRTQALADALLARGYSVHVFQGTRAIAQQFLASRRPVLALIQDRPGRFHYVVIVGWNDDTVVFHDPARAPFLRRQESDFEAAWGPAEHWMLVLEAPPHRSEAANRAKPASAPPSPGRDAAMARFLERDYAQAARLAAQAASVNPSDREAWRLLGASRYLSGDPGAALDAWNRAGGPTIDLVRLEGLSRTPHHSVERLVGLRHGFMLTRSDVVRADRRLSLLPARDASRVNYIALPGNLAEVRGAVVEHPLAPSRIEWMLAAARLGIDREFSMSLANLASAGDRLTAAWRFWEGRPAAGLKFAFPTATIGGIAAVSMGWQQEHYATLPATELRQAGVEWTNWAGARLRTSAGGGFGEWTDRGRAGILRVGVEYRPVSDRLAVELTSLGGAGSLPGFTVSTAVLRWRHSMGRFVLLGDSAGAHASSEAPPDQWPGAGTGIARPFLLRAHPLVTDGRITGAAFGRTLAQSTVELDCDVAQRGFGALGLATFVDVARAWDRPDGSTSPTHVDLGAGIRLRLAPGQPAIRLDFAHGLHDGNDAFSAGWQVGWNGGL